jgi:UDP-N-acetylglucosamine--N-acetylmuramyl-(pentapeptide) pyrophosphoryl-undecaprenol N-acetylglucosamine transferase
MPAVAVAGALRALDPEAQFLFVGAGRPAEEAALAPGGWARATVAAAPIKGKGPAGKVRGGLAAVRAFLQAVPIVRRFSPDLAFATGGYSSGPVGIAARALRVPLVIHEQNRRPGLTNRLLGRVARRVFTGDPGAGAGFPPGRTVFAGNPVRPGIFAAAPKSYEAGRGFTLLILGGSQGAASLNRAAARALPGLRALGAGVRVIHQAGAAGAGELRPLYEASGIPFELGAFFTDMERLYREADLALCRAGALTLAELAAAAVPSALVPLPWAADDHQTENARAFEREGAAVLLPESGLTPEGIVSLVGALAADPGRLGGMSRAAMRLARRDAAALMAREIMEIAAPRRDRRGRRAAAAG